MVTRGDATAMNLLLDSSGDTRWLTRVGRSETHENENASTAAFRQISSHSSVSGRCGHIDPNLSFVFAAEVKRPYLEGLVTPSGSTGYCTQC